MRPPPPAMLSTMPGDMKAARIRSKGNGEGDF
jgi:hypothetical protein